MAMDSRLKNLISTTVSVGLAIVAYLLLLAVSNDNQKSWDLTSDKIHSFSQQTQDVVRGLKADVLLYAFLDPNGDSRVVTEILDRYRRMNSHFRYEVVDLERKPTLAESLQVRAYGQGVLEKVGSKPVTESEAPRRERVMSFDEASLTQALLRLSTVEVRKVAFLSGHGERSPAGGGKETLSALGVALGVEGYQADILSLVKAKALPQDLAVLVLAGPINPLLPGEQALIDSYLKQGGKMLFLADLKTPATYSSWLRKYGVELGDSVIIDPASEMAKVEPVFAIGSAYSATHAITKAFADITAFRLCRLVTVGKDAPLGWEGKPTIESLVSTAKTAFVVPVSKILESATASFSADPKAAASYSMAVAGLYPRTSVDSQKSSKSALVSARIVVVGSVDSFTDRLLTFASNRDFILNAVNWLAQSENQITVRTKDPKSQPLVLNKDKQRILNFIFGLLIPFLVFLTGVLVAMGRRRGPVS